MKRVLAITAVCLVLGATINVLVAWGIGMFADPSAATVAARLGLHSETPTAAVPGQAEKYWPSRSIDAPGITARHWMRTEPRAEYVSSPDAGYSVLEIRYGWPTRSFRAWSPSLEISFVRQPERLAEIDMDSAWIIGLPSPRDRSPYTTRRIPLEPLWPGFAISTAFYSVLVWLLAFAPFALRRARRRRRGRGLCTACGYDIAQLASCPECGAPSPRRGEGGREAAG